MGEKTKAEGNSLRRHSLAHRKRLVHPGIFPRIYILFNSLEQQVQMCRSLLHWAVLSFVSSLFGALLNFTTEGTDSFRTQAAGSDI